MIFVTILKVYRFSNFSRIFREHKLLRIALFRIFKDIYFREKGQNSRKSRKFLFSKVCTLKVQNAGEIFTQEKLIILMLNFQTHLNYEKLRLYNCFYLWGVEKLSVSMIIIQSVNRECQWCTKSILIVLCCAHFCEKQITNFLIGVDLAIGKWDFSNNFMLLYFSYFWNFHMYYSFVKFDNLMNPVLCKHKT